MRLSAIFSFTILVDVIPATLQTVHASEEVRYLRRKTASATESNEVTRDWAGAVLKTPPDGDTFVDIATSVTVPGPPAGDRNESAVSVWVGIDGYIENVNKSMVQAGFDVIERTNGTVDYRAWVRWSPADTIYIGQGDFAFAKDDVVIISLATFASSTRASASFSIIDSGADYSTEFNAPSDDFAASAQSLEWVVGRLHNGKDSHDTTPRLLNFGTIAFTECKGTTLTSGYVTTGNATGVDMSKGSGSELSARTEIDGSTVKVSWLGS